MSEESVDTDDVRHVADLARVDLDEDEVGTFRDQFADILEYFALLDNVEETEPEPDLVNVLRPDEERPGLSQSSALANAPETEGGKFKAPRVSSDDT